MPRSLDADETLHFEHVSEFELGPKLAVGDPAYLGSGLTGTVRGKVELSRTIDVLPGGWHAFTVGAPRGPVEFLLLCHVTQLIDDPLPDFDQAESPGMLPLDGDRILALDAQLRDRSEVFAAIAEVDAEALPVTVAHAGVACQIPRPGLYPLFVSRERPRSVVFVAFSGD